jgi:hypothetical protein
LAATSHSLPAQSKTALSLAAAFLALATPVFAAPNLSQTPSQPAEAATVQAPEAPNPAESAASFVRSYAAATAKRQAIARWRNPICLRITGLGNTQAAAVKDRVEDVARGLGVEVQPAGCKRANVEIGFTSDPQQMLDDVIKTNGHLMGDPTSGTQSARTVTLPVQAWYLTNGKDVAANDAGGLKALADYHAGGAAGLMRRVLYQTPSSNAGVSNYSIPGGLNIAPTAPLGGWGATDNSRQFFNVFIIVDIRRTGGADLRLLSDYVAMLAFSQPQSLGSCQALPSITDLFASCPGRVAPDGLTLADTAYLHALYAAGQQKRLGGHPGYDQVQGVPHPALVADVADAMAPLLANAKVIAR